MTDHPSQAAPDAESGHTQPAYVTFILDETGSMMDCKGAAIAGFNAYLNTLREMPIPVKFTLTLFNSDKLQVRHRDTAVAQVPDLTDETYQPVANTPLYDAIGCTLKQSGQDAAPESKKLCVILTDGRENTSREYTRDGIFRLIAEHQQRGWTFIYLGADHDAWAVTDQLGIGPDNLAQFSKGDTGPMFSRLGMSSAIFLTGGRHDTKKGFWRDQTDEPPHTSPDKGE